MTARSLSAEERAELLQDLASLKSDDDDAVQQDPKWFLPLAAHTKALRPETLVVRGGRGAGKTALFHFLTHISKDPTLAGVLEATEPTSWVEGFSSAIEHPSREVVGAFATASSDDHRRHFWLAWLCARLAATTRSGGLPSRLIDAAKQLDAPKLAAAAAAALPELSVWLDAIERSATTTLTVTYDTLDRIGSDATTGRLVTASLLAMWSSLADRYRRIRPKVFVREDLFRAALSAFPDASKLDARSVSLDWRVEDLYRVLIKHMANTSTRLKDWISESQRGIPLSEGGALGWLPPRTLPETGKVSQKNFVDHLVGELMGSGAKKGYAYTWIPNRLQDAHTRVVPRSILSLLRNAAVHASERGPKAQRLRLLAPEELVAALERTSRRRAQELQEEFPVVARLANLKGRTVMLERAEALRALARPIEGAHAADGEDVLRELIDLGVMSERADGRIDVPDIYRYGFGILRRGGVRRPR